MESLKKPNEEQRDLIERFLIAFNRIEKYLKHKLQESDGTSFSYLVTQYGERYFGWNCRDIRKLRAYADLRNLLVHNREDKFSYHSVPTNAVVEDIETIERNLTQPEKVIPKYQRDVVSLQTDDSLLFALKKIEDYKFSQFPVYTPGKEFRGLITENGITRWLARHVINQLSIVEFEDVTIEEAMDLEEDRQNYKFISRNRSVLEVVGFFSRNPFLEAVLITQDGKQEQKLLGIVTRWDILAEA